MLKGKSAIVTGSTSGIGLGIATALATAGVDIMLNGFGDAAAIAQLKMDLASKDPGVRAAYSRGRHVEAGRYPRHRQAGRGRVRQGRHPGQQCRHPAHRPGRGFSRRSKWDAIIAIKISAPRSTCDKGGDARHEEARNGGASSTSPRRTGWWRATGQGGLCRRQARPGRADQGGGDRGLHGRRGIVRVTPHGEASLVLSGANLVGLAFSPLGTAILATSDAVYDVDLGVEGLNLF